MVTKMQAVGMPHLPIPIANRREFLRACTTSAAGLFGSLLLPEAIFGTTTPGGMEQQSALLPIQGKRQYPIVVVWLQGGAAHFDTFDIRERTAPEEVKGPFNAISTNIKGVYVSELLPMMAQRMNQGALLKNIYHRQSDHGDATRLCLTGSQQKKEASGDSLFGKPKNTPALIQLSEFISRNNIGYTVFNANDGRQPYGGIQEKDSLFVQCDFKNNSYRSPFGEISDRGRFRSRLDLLNALNGNMADSTDPQTIRYRELQQKAVSILDGNLGDAFNLEMEPDRIRDRFGNNPFGKAALISKRLVQAGAQLVLINDGFWDSHYDIKKDLEKLVPRLDRGLSALIDTLKDEAIIVVGTEFGRTPRVNGSKGRDHWPDSSFMFIAGPGIEPRVVGKVDNAGKIIGNDGQYDASNMGEAILNAAGYARYVVRGNVVTNERFPTYPIFTK